MLKIWHIYRLNLIVTAVMSFSIGCFFATEYPDTPIVVWIALIFIGACMKIWLSHQCEKIKKAEEKRETSEADKNCHTS